MFSPDRAAFHEAAANGSNLIPVAQSWPADLETPLTTWIKVGADHPPGVLLESVEGGETLGRWSVIACDPLWTATARQDRLVQRWRDGREQVMEGNPFGLRRCLAPTNAPALRVYRPSASCTARGYELIQWIESSVPVHQRTPDPPDASGC